MGARSAPGEADAGALYPTTIEDSNGNQILIQYAQGAGGTAANTSARITQITDTRATGTNPSYAFTYDATPYDPSGVPHLTTITNQIGSSESYTFGYATNQGLI